MKTKSIHKFIKCDTVEQMRAVVDALQRPDHVTVDGHVAVDDQFGSGKRFVHVCCGTVATRFGTSESSKIAVSAAEFLSEANE